MNANGVSDFLIQRFQLCFCFQDFHWHKKIACAGVFFDHGLRNLKFPPWLNKQTIEACQDDHLTLWFWQPALQLVAGEEKPTPLKHRCLSLNSACNSITQFCVQFYPSILWELYHSIQTAIISLIHVYCVYFHNSIVNFILLLNPGCNSVTQSCLQFYHSTPLTTLPFKTACNFITQSCLESYQSIMHPILSLKP